MRWHGGATFSLSCFCSNSLTLSWRRFVSYRSQSITLHSKSIDLHSNQWTSFYMIETTVMKELMNCIFRCETKRKDDLLEIRLVLISNCSETVSTIKNYKNLIYANQLKKRICRPNISMIQNTKVEYKSIENALLWMYFLPKLCSDWAKWCYKDMILTLKLRSRSSDSTKMPFLPAIKPPVIRRRIVIPQTRLNVEP